MDIKALKLQSNIFWCKYLSLSSSIKATSYLIDWDNYFGLSIFIFRLSWNSWPYLSLLFKSYYFISEINRKIHFIQWTYCMNDCCVTFQAVSVYTIKLHYCYFKSNQVFRINKTNCTVTRLIGLVYFLGNVRVDYNNLWFCDSVG